MLLVGFAFKYLYGIFPSLDYEQHPELIAVHYEDFFPLTDLNPKMDARNFWYLVGERVMDMIQFFLLSEFLRCWQTILIWILSVGYIFDYLITFHTSYYGEVYMVSVGIIVLISLISFKWKM